MKVVLNTSISALDTPEQIKYRLEQYNRYKKYGVSVLRIVSCEFNQANVEGKRLHNIQDELFKNENIIDNPLRLPSNYYLLTSGVIKAEKVWDLNSQVLMSLYNKKTYVGKCKDCPEMCGLCYEKQKSSI